MSTRALFSECLSIRYTQLSRDIIAKRLGRLSGIVDKDTRQPRKTEVGAAIEVRRRNMEEIVLSPRQLPYRLTHEDSSLKDSERNMATVVDVAPLAEPSMEQ